jgi:hypothetical protein
MTLDINKFDITKFKVLNKLNFYIVFILSISFIIYCSYKNTLGVGDFIISLLLVLISNNNKKDIVSCYNDIIEIKSEISSIGLTEEVKVENVNVANNLIEYISYIHAYIIFIKQTTFVTILTVGVYCNLI